MIEPKSEKLTDKDLFIFEFSHLLQHGQKELKPYGMNPKEYFLYHIMHLKVQNIHY